MKIDTTTRLASLGNLLGGIVGGTVLAFGVRLSRLPDVSADGLLPYLIGATAALGIVPYFRKQERIAIASFVGALLCVAVVVAVQFQGEKIFSSFAYVGLVSLLFTFIFVPRSLRTQAAVRGGGQIATVELAYSAGYLIALLVPMDLYGPSDVVWAFGAGALLLSGGAFLDLRLSSRVPTPVVSAHAEQSLGNPRDEGHGRRAHGTILLICALTIACQLVLQRSASVFTNTLPLVFFEIGVTLAPLAYVAAKAVGLATGRIEFKLPRAISVSFGTVSLACFSLSLLYLMFAPGSILAMGVLSIAIAFLYEFVSLGLLESLKALDNRIATAFAVNATLSTAIYFLALQSGKGVESLYVLGTVGMGMGVLALSFRKARREHSLQIHVQQKPSGAA